MSVDCHLAACNRAVCRVTLNYKQLISLTVRNIVVANDDAGVVRDVANYLFELVGLVFFIFSIVLFNASVRVTRPHLARKLAPSLSASVSFFPSMPRSFPSTPRPRVPFRSHEARKLYRADFRRVASCHLQCSADIKLSAGRESLVCYQPSDASPRGRQTAVACCYRLRLNGPSASCGLSARHQVCVGAVPFVPPFAPSHIFARRSVCRHRYIDRCTDGRTSGVRISSGSHRLAVNALFASSPQTAELRRLLPSTRPVFRAAASLPAISETICTRRQTHAAARSERGVVCNEISYGNLKRIYMHRLT
jgi:hypothetical protein